MINDSNTLVIIVVVLIMLLAYMLPLITMRRLVFVVAVDINVMMNNVAVIVVDPVNRLRKT